MSCRPAFPLVLLTLAGWAGCGTLAPSELPQPDPVASSSTTTTAPEPAAPKSAVAVATPSNDPDPWQDLLPPREGDPAEAMEEDPYERLRGTLGQRMQRRSAEDKRIAAAARVLEAELGETCAAEVLDPMLDTLQREEGSSLQADRRTLWNFLSEASPEERATMWAQGSPGSTIVAPRKQMAQALQASRIDFSPSNPSAQSLDDRRAGLQLQLQTDQGNATLSSMLSTATLTIGDTDPTAGTAPRAVLAALTEIDRDLLALQTERYQSVRQLCTDLPREEWVVLLANGSVRSFLGSVGGTSGMRQGRMGGQGGGTMGGSSSQGGAMRMPSQSSPAGGPQVSGQLPMSPQGAPAQGVSPDAIPR